MCDMRAHTHSNHPVSVSPSLSLSLSLSLSFYVHVQVHARVRRRRIGCRRQTGAFMSATPAMVMMMCVCVCVCVCVCIGCTRVYKTRQLGNGRFNRDHQIARRGQGARVPRDFPRRRQAVGTAGAGKGGDCGDRGKTWLIARSLASLVPSSSREREKTWLPGNRKREG